MTGMGTAGRIALAAAGAAVLVVLFLVLRQDGDGEPADVAPAAEETQTATGATETETDAATDTVAETDAGTTAAAEGGDESADTVRARVQIGPGGPAGVERIDATQGQRVVLTVQSDVRDHVHVHGYDLFADVVPGRPTRITFRADVPGRFEIELEDRHQAIAELRVQP
jgi:hypothetical protein